MALVSFAEFRKPPETWWNSANGTRALSGFLSSGRDTFALILGQFLSQCFFHHLQIGMNRLPAALEQMILLKMTSEVQCASIKDDDAVGLRSDSKRTVWQK